MQLLYFFFYRALNCFLCARSLYQKRVSSYHFHFGFWKGFLGALFTVEPMQLFISDQMLRCHTALLFLLCSTSFSFLSLLLFMCQVSVPCTDRSLMPRPILFDENVSISSTFNLQDDVIIQLADLHPQCHPEIKSVFAPNVTECENRHCLRRCERESDFFVSEGELFKAHGVYA